MNMQQIKCNIIQAIQAWIKLKILKIEVRRGKKEEGKSPFLKGS